MVEDLNRENLKAIKNTLPNKLRNPESLKNNNSGWKALQVMCT